MNPLKFIGAFLMVLSASYLISLLWRELFIPEVAAPLSIVGGFLIGWYGSDILLGRRSDVRP